MGCSTYKFRDGSAAILNTSGPTRIIESGGQTFYFTFHEYCGPMMENKHGRELQSMPPKRSPFWDALHFWLKQGKRMNGNRCVFDLEMKLVHIMAHVGGRNYVMLDQCGPRNSHLQQFANEYNETKRDGKRNE